MAPAELAAALTPLDQFPAQWRRRADAGEYLFRVGDTARARHQLEAVVQEMPAGPDRAEALLILGKVLRYDAGDDAVRSVLQQALAEASASGTLQARVHIAIARRLYDLRAAAEHAAAGLALAQLADDPGLTAEALVAKLRLDFYTGRGLDVGLGERAMELEQQARPPRVWDRAAMALGICLKQSDRFDEARLVDQGIGHRRVAHQPHHVLEHSARRIGDDLHAVRQELRAHLERQG